MSEIRPLSAGDFDAFARIFVDAYPGMKATSKEEQERVKQRLLKAHQEEPTVTGYGLFREGQLLGGMLFYDFTMNFLGARIAAGGVGQVAVDLLRKKEHVAKEMMLYFVRHYRECGAPVTMLYPFRPDFYKKMGFGYGTKMSQYRVEPSALPKGPSKTHVRYLNEDDKQAVLDCYNRRLDRTHGMMVKSEREVNRLMQAPYIVGYERDGQIQGYLVFNFEYSENFLLNDIHIREFIYESREALSELLTFLQTQADQVRHIIFNTQDEFFHHLLLDPRNGSPTLIPDVYHESNLQGMGLMYRVVDIPGIFRLLGERDFGGQTCRLKLTIEDSFLPENAGSMFLAFENGRLHLLDSGSAHDVEVWMDVAEFSSLLLGTVPFRSLYEYGLADVSDPGYVGIIDRIFAVRDKPICTTSF
jgi:predicted acetyltransferase